MMNEQYDLIMGEITALKQILTNTDYQAIKHSEGLISDDDYAEMLEFRAELRAKINDYEAQLEELTANE